MRFISVIILLISSTIFSQIIDSTPIPENVPVTGKGQTESAVEIIRAGMDTNQTDTETGQTDVSQYDFLGLNEHIGPNGVSLFFSFVGQTYAKNTNLPNAHTFGAGLSGDILTGLSFIHLVPMLQYWSYSEKIAFGPFVSQTYRDASLSFNAVFMTQRFTKRKIRLYGGGGPSFHLSISSQYTETGLSETTPGFRTGIGALGGVELPLNGMVSFLITGIYKQTYDWNIPYRRFFMISFGFAV